MSGYTKVPNEITRNPNLSLQAKGLFLLIRSKPAGWNFSGRRVAAESANGFQSTNKALHELEQAGLLIRSKLANGRSEWILQNPDSQNQNLAVNPDSGNQHQAHEPDSQNQNLASEPDSGFSKLRFSQVADLGTISNTLEEVKHSKSHNTEVVDFSLKNEEPTKPTSKIGKKQKPSKSTTIAKAEAHDKAVAETPKINPLHERIIAIFTPNFRRNLKRDSSELKAWKNAKAQITEADVTLLERFYALPKSESFDATWSRKTAPTQLFNQWATQIGFAESHLKPQQHAPAKSDQTGQQGRAEPTPPDNWREALREFFHREGMTGPLKALDAGGYTLWSQVDPDLRPAVLAIAEELKSKGAK